MTAHRRSTWRLATVALALVATRFGGAAALAQGVPDAGAPAAPAAPAAPEPGAPTAVPPPVETAPPAGDASAPAAGDGPGLFEQGLAAGGAAPVADSPAAPKPAAYTLNGYVRGDAFAGKVPGFATGDMKAAYGELSLALKTAKETHGDAYAEARLRHGLQGGDQQQTFVEVREAYANAYAGPVDLRLGRQIIVWGRADALNPTNNLTPFDLRIRSPIDDDRRVGNVGARAFLKLSPIRIEGVWMPLYAASELPPVGLPQFVSFGAPVYPKPELQNGLLAGRVHLELPAFEMSVSYLHGSAPLPGLTLTRLTFDPVSPEVLVSRTAYTHNVVGFDFSTALGDVLALRAEAAYRKPTQLNDDTIHKPRPDLQYVLGLDRAFGSLNVIAQYLGRYVFDWKKENGPGTPLSGATLMQMRTDFLENSATTAINLELARTNQILFNQTARVQHLATVRLEWLTLHDTLTLTALGVFNATTHEWLAAPRLGYRLSDSLTTYVGAEIFKGPNGTLFGLIDELLSAGYAELRYMF